MLDASVVIGLRDPDDAHHESAVEAVQEARAGQRPLILPASSLAEILVGASRLDRAAVDRVEQFVDAVIEDVRPIDGETARIAALYRARRRSLRLPDALVLAVGEQLQADAVVTADEAWKDCDARVRVIRYARPGPAKQDRPEPLCPTGSAAPRGAPCDP